MTVIGALLVVIAAVFLILVLFGGSDAVVEFGFGIGSLDLSATAVFLLGAATVLIFVSGLELLRTGLRRSLARRRELKKARALLSEEEKRERRHDRHEGRGGADRTDGPGDTAAGAPTDAGSQSRTTSSPTTSSAGTSSAGTSSAGTSSADTSSADTSSAGTAQGSTAPSGPETPPDTDTRGSAR